MPHKIYLIAAADPKNGIGIKGKLPWDLKKDLAFFQKKTIKTENTNTRNMVIMGKKTWESLPEKHRPLPGRKNIVLTSDKEYKAPGAEIARSLEESIEKADERIADIYIIGGGKIYEQFIGKKYITGIYLTRIKREFNCDAFFPKIPGYFKPHKIKETTENGIELEFLLYRRK